MLLLVLILILIAFGLLVVALLSGSVLWAWVSVAVSAVAALVLIVDALQRRAALRAARAGADDPAIAGALDYSSPEIEPVTEILPVIPPAGAGRPDADGDPGRPVPGDPDDERSSGFDQGPLGGRTVAMSTRKPPGSDEGPSGATVGSQSNSGTSSPSVTAAGVNSSDDPPGRSAIERAGAAERGNEATVVVSRADREVGNRAGADEPAGAPPRGGSVGDPGAGPADREAGIRPSDPTVQGVAPSDALPPEQVSADRMPAQQQPAEPPPPERDLSGVAVAEEADDPAAEPPEEDRDAAVSGLVATLIDEVVVVDEQPRYHVTGCRALVARPVIPLPVGEAVELGFTPCGWCAPDATLAERHPAEAR